MRQHERLPEPPLLIEEAHDGGKLHKVILILPVFFAHVEKTLCILFGYGLVYQFKLLSFL